MSLSKTLKGSPLRKGLHDVSSEEGTEVDEERVTIRSLDEKVAVGGKNFSTSSRFSHILYTSGLHTDTNRSRTKTIVGPRSRTTQTPQFLFLDHG
jgi:hypothetical protein